MSTADLLQEAFALLDERGVPTERRPGCRTRGRGRLRVRGWVEHDTSDARPLSRERMLELLAEGHGSLRNALCNVAIPRQRPAAVLIAARTAWHAGRGGWKGLSGNSSVGGTEIQRAVGQEITDEQLEIAREVTAAMVEVFGFPARRVCLHREWAPRRKQDPHGIDGPSWRAGIRAVDHAAPTGIPAPEEDEVLAKFSDGNKMWVLFTGSGKVKHLSPSAYKAINRVEESGKLGDQLVNLGDQPGLSQAGFRSRR